MNSPIPSTQSPLRLLIVDDESAMLDLLEIALLSEGFRLTTAANGPEALCFFEQDDFDLVITDRNMPEMDGDALATEIKRRDPAMPILLISGHPPATLDTAKFDFILSKPFTKQGAPQRYLRIDEPAGRFIRRRPATTVRHPLYS